MTVSPAAASPSVNTPDTKVDVADPTTSTAAARGAAATAEVRRTHLEHDEANEVEGDADGDEGAGHGERARVSEGGRSYGALADLASADPERFKVVAGGVADRLRAAAGGLSTDQSSLLTALADQFTKASQTGQLEALQLGARPSQASHAGVRRYAEQQSRHATKGVDISDLLKGMLQVAGAR